MLNFDNQCKMLKSVTSEKSVYLTVILDCRSEDRDSGLFSWGWECWKSEPPVGSDPNVGSDPIVGIGSLT